MFSMSGSTRSQTPGSIRAARHCATRTVACRIHYSVGTPDVPFSGLNTFKVGVTRYLLHLACFRAYASTSPLPETPQGSIPGSRRTITRAGFPPARTYGLARPHNEQGHLIARILDATYEIVRTCSDTFRDVKDRIIRHDRVNGQWNYLVEPNGFAY